MSEFVHMCEFLTGGGVQMEKIPSRANNTLSRATAGHFFSSRAKSTYLPLTFNLARTIFFGPWAPISEALTYTVHIHYNICITLNFAYTLTIHIRCNIADQVQYNINGWLDKNKDPIQECVVELMANSKEPLVSSFFKDPDDGGAN